MHLPHASGSERALAHSENQLLTWWGSCSYERIREMARVMCAKRSVSFCQQYCIDNGTMIAELGKEDVETQNPTNLDSSEINPSLRTDHTIVTWK